MLEILHSSMNAVETHWPHPFPQNLVVHKVRLAMGKLSRYRLGSLQHQSMPYNDAVFPLSIVGTLKLNSPTLKFGPKAELYGQKYTGSWGFRV